MKKGAHLDKEVFGIPFDRNLRHTPGLDEKKCLNKSIASVCAHFTVWEIFLLEKFSIVKGLS